MSEADPKEGLTDSVIRRLNERKGQWREIADLSAVPYPTLAKIARGVIPEPGGRKLERLDRVLAQLDETDKKRADSPQLPLSLAPGR